MKIFEANEVVEVLTCPACKSTDTRDLLINNAPAYKGYIGIKCNHCGHKRILLEQKLKNYCQIVAKEYRKIKYSNANVEVA